MPERLLAVERRSPESAKRQSAGDHQALEQYCAGYSERWCDMSPRSIIAAECQGGHALKRPSAEEHQSGQASKQADKRTSEYPSQTDMTAKM